MRERLHAYLLEMDAFKFEELIKLLLEEMGYENVVTTSPTNDKGVDVIGTIELGISAVREVIQAKRHKGTINRPVLDQLRGSLHRFNAVRGTIITTGRFSKGVEEAAFERGAAPITLIDGAKLVDLLVENQIGVNSRQVEYLEFAPEKLAQFEAGGWSAGVMTGRIVHASAGWQVSRSTGVSVSVLIPFRSRFSNWEFLVSPLERPPPVRDNYE